MCQASHWGEKVQDTKECHGFNWTRSSITGKVCLAATITVHRHLWGPLQLKYLGSSQHRSAQATKKDQISPSEGPSSLWSSRHTTADTVGDFNKSRKNGNFKDRRQLRSSISQTSTQQPLHLMHTHCHRECVIDPEIYSTHNINWLLRHSGNHCRSQATRISFNFNQSMSDVLFDSKLHSTSLTPACQEYPLIAISVFFHSTSTSTSSSSVHIKHPSNHFPSHDLPISDFLIELKLELIAFYATFRTYTNVQWSKRYGFQCSNIPRFSPNISSQHRNHPQTTT